MKKKIPGDLLLQQICMADLKALTKPTIILFKNNGSLYKTKIDSHSARH